MQSNDERLRRMGLLLEWLTLAWNVAGVGVLIVAAVRANSVALAGFGLDSLVEIGASTVVIWQLTAHGQRRDRVALRLIGAAFLALAVYLLVQSGWTLLHRTHPATSPGGMLWLALTFVVMLALAAGKAKTGKRLGSAVLRTEARVTLVDALLAGSVLVGVGLNAGLGWWWTAPLAALGIAGHALREGVHAWSKGGASPG